MFEVSQTFVYDVVQMCLCISPNFENTIQNLEIEMLLQCFLLSI